MSLKTDALSCWPQFSPKSCDALLYGLGTNVFPQWPTDRMGLEQVRTICAEFFSVRGAPQTPLLIHHAGVHQATADKYRMVCPIPSLSAALPPAPQPPPAYSWWTYGSHLVWLLPFQCPSHVDNRDLQLPEMECFVFFLIIPSLGLVKSFVTTQIFI